MQRSYHTRHNTEVSSLTVVFTVFARIHVFDDRLSLKRETRKLLIIFV